MTISEIAKMAQVSSAAVSRYMNGGSISDEKKERIRKVIEETGYVPSVTARMLRTNKSMQIGVIVPKIHSDSISQVVAGIDQIAKEHGYNMFLASTDNESDKELDYILAFQNMNVDGIILCATVITSRHKKLIKDMKTPIVIVGQNVNGCNCIYNDDVNGAYHMAKKLLDAGCRRLAYISVTQKDKAAGKSRTEGLCKALKQHDLSIADVTTIETGFSIEDGKSAMEKLLKQNKRIDGVFCATDSLAIGAMDVLKKNNYKIPEDIKITGIGHNQMSDIIEPALTTVHYYYKNCGLEASKVLLSLIGDSDSVPTTSMKIGFDIVDRDSV